MGSAQTPIKIACLPHFAIYREYLTGYLEYTLRELLERLPLPECKRTSTRTSCLLLYLICPTLTSGVTQNMLRKSICLSALLALGMVGSSLPKTLQCSPGPGRSSNSSTDKFTQSHRK